MTRDHRPFTDDAIDAVARAMTNVEPRADLRARVLAEIDTGRERRVPWTWIAVPVAAAAVILLAITLLPLMRSPGRTPAGTAPIQRTVESSPTPRAPASVARIENPATARTVTRARTTRDAVVRDAGIIVEPPHGTVVVEALPAHEPISVAPVERPAVRFADVTVVPLADLAPIEVEPLPASRGRE
jgi:hypothetical protein